jgi:hypothetical protein
MKQQSDKGRSERESQVGDLVFLKLQLHVQSSLAPRASQKLPFKFFGPYPGACWQGGLSVGVVIDF